ncbi:MAG: SAM-dependent methyltransferase [Lachnospiraceae bacterium]|nr:SAM-dependent methyltransferase [Lachnospiraceae bacterium]
MEQIKELLTKCMGDGLYQIIVSHPRRKGGVSKIKIRPVLIREELLYQESRFEGTQVFHENKTADAVIALITEVMAGGFKQLDIYTRDWEATALVGKKGNVTLKKRKSEDLRIPDLSHNRKKQYLLKESVPVGFLQDLGVQTAEGKIVRSRYDKFRQINRFLEFIEDVLPALPTGRPIRIIDFGCGKSYLTFAMYYYLKILKHYDVDMIGLDLKEEVIRYCNELSKKYGYENLHFYQGDIKDFDRAENVDMVVSLHACDTATDYALARGIKWGAGVILAVPCCQHELNGQMQCDALESVFSYGLIRERSAALFTDALRAALLEAEGYDTQILEFIDMEHTPKNIMIRGILRNRDAKSETEQRYRMQKRQKAAALMTFLHVFPTLDRLLRE